MSHVLNGAAAVALKKDLMVALTRRLSSNFGSQIAAAKALRVRPEQLSRLRNARCHGRFSLGWLLNLAGKLGLRVHVV